MSKKTLNTRPHTHFEESHGFGKVVGIDEAGCGPWAGPVVAAAVVIRPALLTYSFVKDIQDSKKLSELKRVKLVNHLKEVAETNPDALTWQVGSASPQEIDQMNIRQANFLAMTRALEKLTVRFNTILVDGTGGLQASVPVIPIVKGDQHCLSIAIASLFAKVTRDEMMDQLHMLFPLYDWANNKGYGTKNHQEALKSYGVSPHHRLSYKPLHAFRVAAS